MGLDQDPSDVKRVTGAQNQLFNLGRWRPASQANRAGVVGQLSSALRGAPWLQEGEVWVK
jgi:hypothetical protein